MLREAKVVIVTGGGQGIGRAIARRLLEEHCAVVIWEKDGVLGEKAVQELRQVSQAVSILPVDIGAEEDVRSAVAEVMRIFGRVDGLINNAAVSRPDTGPVEQLSLERWNEYLRVNLTGAFQCAKHCASVLRQSRGAIVNIASTRALMSEPNSEAYAAAKGGLLALTHALAISLAPHVRVNAISPGWIDTREETSERRGPGAPPSAQDHAFHPAGRVGRPEDVAGLVAFFLGKDAKYITGANFIVDGGMTRKMIYLSDDT